MPISRSLKTGDNRVFVLSIFILSLCGFASADVSGKDASNELDLFASPACIFSGTFKQTKEVEGLLEPLQSEGIFLSHCKKGIIWKTISPIEESLVFTQAGRRVRIHAGESAILKTQQSRILGELMNGLVAWNPNYVDENFDWQAIAQAPVELELVPKKRSLKRAVHSVRLWKTGLNSNDPIIPENDISVSSAQLDIDILSTNHQSTRITAKIEKHFDDQAERPEFCAITSSIFSRLECAALHNSDIETLPSSISE